MIDKDTIIKELATNHGLILNKKDPLLAAVLLNKIILREYVNELNQHLTESITNVAIKEDVTMTNLRKLLDENQIKNRQEIERVLNQFADNLQGRLHSVISTTTTKNKSSNWFFWLTSAFLVGLLSGGIWVKYFV